MNQGHTLYLSLVVVHIHIHVHACAHVHVYTVSTCTCKLQELHNELCVAYHWIDGQSIVCIEELFIVQILLHIKHVNSQAVHVHVHLHNCMYVI